MKKVFRLLTVFLLNMALAIPTYAKIVEQENVKFKIETEKLLTGDIHFALHLLTPRALVEKFPEAIDLDSQSLIYDTDIRVWLTKTTYVVKKPIGFFSSTEVKEESYVKHLMGPQKVTKIGQDTFKVTVPGSLSYDMKIFLDSDDITTLNNWKVVQAVSSTKKMEVLTQGASSFVVKEYSKFTEHSLGSTSVTAYIPLQENTTLVITFQLTTIKTGLADEQQLKKSFINEIEAVKTLSETFEKK